MRLASMLTFWTAHSSFFILFSLISIPVIGLFARAAIRFGQQWIFSSADSVKLKAFPKFEGDSSTVDSV